MTIILPLKLCSILTNHAISLFSLYLGPTPCSPMFTPTQSITTTAPSPSRPAGLGDGAIAGLTISALAVVVLLCVICTIVCIAVFVCTRKSKRKNTRQKTFGKARFIRSVYILPTLYRAAKSETAKKGSTEQSLASTKEEEGREEEEEEEEQTQQGAEQQGVGQEVEIEVERETSNSDMYVNQQEITNSTDPLTSNEETNDDENLYENNPLARRLFRDEKEEEGKEKQQEVEQDQESTRDYVNKEVFTQPLAPLDTALPSNGVDANDDELYVNNLLARKKLKDLSLYDNEKPDISTATNRAYGVTERSDNLSHLMQSNDQRQWQQWEQRSETNGEDEYVYIDVNKDSPEEEYEDMATFQAPNFTKKQRR